MNNQLWKIKKEKLNKTNFFLYSNFIKQNFKIDQVMILIKFGNGQLIIQRFFGSQFGILQK